MRRLKIRPSSKRFTRVELILLFAVLSNSAAFAQQISTVDAGTTTRLDAVVSQSEQAHTEEANPSQKTLEVSPQLGSDANSKAAPGYPQDATMAMPMDAAVAKPENNGLAPNWSGAFQGMMRVVRVLPPDKYEKLMADIKAGRIDPAQKQGMQMDSMPGMNMNHGNMKDMPGMEQMEMTPRQKEEKPRKPTMEEQMKM